MYMYGGIPAGTEVRLEGNSGWNGSMRIADYR